METVSFVSEKNTNIESVLFVIKTPAIQKEEVKEAVSYTHLQGDVEMGQLHQGMLWIIRMEWRRKVLRIKP